jgi:cytidylate kinase
MLVCWTGEIVFPQQQNKIPFVIPIDGGARTGKSTVREIVAATFFRDGRYLNQLNSGLLYRACALVIQQEGKVDDRGGWVNVAQNLNVTLNGDKVVLGGKDVTSSCQSEGISLFTSRISAHPEVRSALKNHQLSFRREPGLVPDGRDMGELFVGENVVRFFLTASPREKTARAVRRAIEKGDAVNFDMLFREIVVRDVQDETRSVSPLKPHPLAVVIDTDKLTAVEVASQIVTRARAALGL